MGIEGTNEQIIITVVKEEDQTTNNNTTLVDDLELKKILKPNKKYRVDVRILAQGNITAGLDYTFKAISGTVYALFNSASTLIDLLSFGTEKALVMNGNIRQIIGTVFLETGSGGGELQFQFAQTLAIIGNTTIKAGSSLVIYELN